MCRRGNKEGEVQRTARVILSGMELQNRQFDARLNDIIKKEKEKWWGKKQQFPSQRIKTFEAPQRIGSKATQTALTLISASVKLTYK